MAARVDGGGRGVPAERDRDRGGEDEDDAAADRAREEDADAGEKEDVDDDEGSLRAIHSDLPGPESSRPTTGSVINLVRGPAAGRAGAGHGGCTPARRAVQTGRGGCSGRRPTSDRTSLAGGFDRRNRPTAEGTVTVRVRPSVEAG